MHIKTNSETETISLGKKIAKVFPVPGVLALHGTLGSGKTTFTKGIVAGLFPRTKNIVKSPSFALVNQYEGAFPVFHIDCYRIDEEAEFEDIGIDEFLYSDGITIIEWPEKIKNLLPKETVHIKIAAPNECERIFTFEGSSSYLSAIRRKWDGSKK